MAKKKILIFILFVVLFIAFWNVCDLLWSVFISGKGYQFSFTGDILFPLVIAAVLGFTDFFIKKKK